MASYGHHYHLLRYVGSEVVACEGRYRDRKNAHAAAKRLLPPWTRIMQSAQDYRWQPTTAFGPDLNQPEHRLWVFTCTGRDCRNFSD